MHADIIYCQAMKNILDHGVTKADRTGVGTISLFGVHMRFDLSE
jgi:thymidylate synthase